MKELVYKPSDWGARYHALPHNEALGAGAAGPGKSMVLLMDPVPQVMHEHDRLRLPRTDPRFLEAGMSMGWALHLRRTATTLDQTIARSHRIFPQMDPGAHYSAKDQRWTFTSGFKYEFGHCKDPNSWENFMSNEYTHIAFDELTQFDQEQYEQIKTRLRTSDEYLEPFLRVRSMSNPLMRREKGDAFSIKDPKWVYNYFVKPEEKGNVTLYRVLRYDDGTEEKFTRIYLPAKLDDNPDKRFVAQYKRQLMASPPHIRAALLYGDWNVTPDSYYADVWDRNTCMCAPFKVPEYWHVFRTMDWGYKMPGCVHWWAMDPDENLYCIMELTFQGKTDREVAGLIQNIELDLGLWSKRNKRSRISGPADNQLWEDRGDSAKSKASVMLSLGVPWKKADKGRGSRQENGMRLHARLAAHQNGSAAGSLTIFDCCRELIRTLPGIQTNPHCVDEPEDGGEDHWHDSACYAVSYASRGRRSALRRDDDDAAEFVDRSRGRLGYGSEI